ncbi:MAG: type II restriction endonuclease, partial [Bacteroidetes bacterium]
MVIVNDLIAEFSVEQLRQFFRGKITKFKPKEENYDFLFEDKKEISDNFTDITNIGEAVLNNNDDLLIITAKTNKKLTNRSGKKRQYEIAKNILKEENNDAAFFIFYDEKGNFRFSFIRANFLGTKRDFTNFKRYTYFVSKEQTNKTFISQISKADFNDLDSIQEAFNVEPLTKQFYEKLQHWYFWAIDNVKFPDDAEKEKNGREIAIIRLITRLMFIWFMKVRKLVPENLFDEENIKKNLADFADEDSTYYKAILQNLFFATLNTKQADRKFRSE